MKKWLCLALALLTLTVCVWAAAESTDWNYDLNYAILRGYNGTGGDVTVPAEIDGYTVDVIGVSVFSSEAITSAWARTSFIASRMSCSCTLPWAALLREKFTPEMAK